MPSTQIMLATLIALVATGCSVLSDSVSTPPVKTSITESAATSDRIPPHPEMGRPSPDTTAATTPPDSRIADWGNDLTKPIRLLADTQLHESRGTASRFFSRAGDEFIPFTIRTGQQVIGGADILYETLVAPDGTSLTLHLGDAIDVSCQTEWDQFSKVMHRALSNPGPSSWLFTPGNHDGFLVGNFYPQIGDKYKLEYWSNVCNAGRVLAEKVINDSIRKPAVIASYVDRLPWPANSPRNRQQDSFCLGDMSFCVSYEIKDAAWSSYLIQLVRLPGTANESKPVYALMLDTSDYPTRPYFGRDDIRAGEQGNLSQAQLQAARALLDRLPANARFFVTAHHPWIDWRTGRWDEAHTEALKKIFSNERFLNFLVSAHTHQGDWYVHTLGHTLITELNIGSLIDSPLYYRTLRFIENTEGDVSVHTGRVLIDQGFALDCKPFAGRGTGEGYSVDDQFSFSDRFRNLPAPIMKTLRTIPATVKFLTFWQQKHTELSPQLLVYADVVDSSMPKSETFTFKPFGEAGRSTTFANSAELSARLRTLGRCHHQTKCSVQEKGHLLLALEKYYWSLPGQSTTFAQGHAARFCFATRSAAEAGAISKVPDQVISRTTEARRVVKPHHTTKEGQ